MTEPVSHSDERNNMVSVKEKIESAHRNFISPSGSNQMQTPQVHQNNFLLQLFHGVRSVCIYKL